MTVILHQGTVFEDNIARNASGGAMFIRGRVNLSVEDVEFVGNWAWMRGGGIFYMGTSAISIRDAYFIENTSNFTGGGAIYAEVQ